MENPRFEKLAARRDELSDLLDGMEPDDPEREELQALIGNIDRINLRSAVKAVKPRRQRTVPTVEADGSVLIATVPKGKNAQIRIYAKTWNGRQVIDVRVYALFKDSTDFTPTRKGISFAAGKLDAVLGGLALAQQYVPEKTAS